MTPAPSPHTAPPATATAFRVCFVCTGNICRSPMAEVVLAGLAARAGLDDRLAVDSAGTGDWHVGHGADPRAVATLAAHGLDGTAHRARQFDPDWFAERDLVIALDAGHERILGEWARDADDRARIRLLTDLDRAAARRGVPDPYYGDESDFEHSYAMIESACRALFAQLEPALRTDPTKGRP